LGEGVLQICDDVVGTGVDLLLAVAAGYVAVAAQPEVAVVVAVGLVGGGRGRGL
jgi:hypothetical protein